MNTLTKILIPRDHSYHEIKDLVLKLKHEIEEKQLELDKIMDLIHENKKLKSKL